MRGITVFFTLVLVAAVLAAVSIGTYYFFRRKKNVLIPPRESYYPSSSYNPGATQTQQIHRLPPPPPSHPQSSYRSPTTYAQSQATPTPAHPENGYTVYRPSVASPYARTPSQTQPSSTRTPLPSTRTQRPSSPRIQPSPHAPSREPRLLTTPAFAWSNSHSNEPASAHSQIAPKTPAPYDFDSTVYRSSATSPHVQQTQPSSKRTQPSSCVPPRVHSGSEPTLPTIVQVISPDLHSDELASIEDLEFAKKLREQARRRGRERSDACSRAKSAQKKGYRGAAQAHRQEAMAHKSAMEGLDKRAAKIIFREKNKNRKEGGMVDLHGLLVAEAIGFAKEELQSAKSRGDEVVRFIVGKGLHAEDGVAKIRPALGAFCTKRGLSHSLDPKNSGVLIVRLDYE